MPNEPQIHTGTLIAMAYAELYARHRALLAILERHGIVQREHFETEVQDYMGEHFNELVQEGLSWWRALVRARLADSGTSEEFPRS